MSVNLNQKVKENTFKWYDERMNLYLKTGRITKKGEIFDLLIEDHMELERKRMFLNSSNDISKELFLTLERVQDLLIKETEHFLLQTERIKKQYQDQLDWRDQKIAELEQSIQRYKTDLEEKIIENAEIKRGLERIRKQVLTEKKEKSVGIFNLHSFLF